MKRPASQSKDEDSKRSRHLASNGLSTYEAILDAIDGVDLSSDQLFSITKKSETLYCLKVNLITQHFPTDLLRHLLETAQIPTLPLLHLLPLRLVSQSWNRVICSLPKINIKARGVNCTRIFEVFSHLRSFTLDKASTHPTDFSIMTGLTKLTIDEGSPFLWFEERKGFSTDLTELAPLTNLKKLTLRSRFINQLTHLTSLTSLHLKTPFKITNHMMNQLPNLTRLVCDSTHFIVQTGFGIYRDTDEDGRLIQYEGDWNSSFEFHGQGTYITQMSRYEGQWVNGEEHGNGICYFWDPKGCEEGMWDELEPRQSYRRPKPWEIDKNGPDVDRYEGEFKHGKQNGQGTYYHSNGGRYEGQWVNDEEHGHGVFYFRDGSKYEGHWVDGRRHGHGVLDKPKKGEKYDGNWKDGEKHGNGTLYRLIGTTFEVEYEGEWRRGKWHGHGIYHGGDGSNYEGQFKNGKRHGKGTSYSSSGDRFEGNWVNGKKRGFGIKYCINGEKIEKEWGKKYPNKD